MRLVANISSEGAAGFESFSIDGKQYLASAHFWGPSGESPIWEVTVGGGSKPLLSVVEFQSLGPTNGAHGWDFFMAPVRGKNVHFLVVPNYYGCGDSRGPPTGDCKSTTIYRWDGSEFEEVISLATSGPGQTDHFVMSDGRAFIVVGENFNDEACTFFLSLSQRQHMAPTTLTQPESTQVCIYQLKAGRHGFTFVKVQALRVAGAGAIALAEIGGVVYLVGTSYHDPLKGWKTHTIVFRMLEKAENELDPEALPHFVPHQVDV